MANQAESKLTEQQTCNLLRQYAEGELNATIAERFALSKRDVINIARCHRVKRGDLEGCRQAIKAMQKIEIGTHLAPYKKVRRGFDIPPDREPEFINLLLQGYSRHDAARKMGVL